MPPRFAYWTILIDGRPTAFRARDQQELLPTFHQLKRTNDDVVFRWFARGRLWESQQQERDARRRPKAVAGGQRGRDWRPGGQHKDPRARFAKASAGSGREPDRHPRPRPWKPRPEPPRSTARRKFRKRGSNDKDHE